MAGPPDPPPGMPEGMDMEETKRWIELMVKTELEGLQRAKALRVDLSAYQAWLLLQLLQQGYRVLRGDARALAKDLGDTIVEGYLAQGTVLRRFAELGWTDHAVRLNASDPPEDVQIPEAYKRAFGLQ